MTMDGFTYQVYIRPWKNGLSRYEVIRWETGFKCTWERVSYTEYLKIKKCQANERVIFKKS